MRQAGEALGGADTKGGVDALSRAGSKETSGEAQGGADARERWESARRIRGRGKRT